MNILLERYQFHLRQQQESETISDYAIQVRYLAASCRFGNFEESLVRDHVLFGLLNKQITLQIIQNGGNPSVNEIIEWSLRWDADSSAEWRTSDDKGNGHLDTDSYDSVTVKSEPMDYADEDEIFVAPFAETQMESSDGIAMKDVMVENQKKHVATKKVRHAQPKKRKVADNAVMWKRIDLDNVITFHCLLCEALRRTCRGIRSHINNHPKCEQCQQYFRSEKSAAKHTQQAHGSPETQGPYVCSVCHKVLKQLNVLKQHQRHHHPEILPGFDSQRQYECYLCRNKYKSHPLVRTHMYDKHVKTGKHVLCTLCGRNFRNISELNLHWKRKHNDNGMDVRTYKCERCAMSFITKGALNKHQLVHMEQRPFECDLCPKKFKTSSNLSQHKLTHAAPRHQCPLCSYSGRAPGCLRKHMRSHTAPEGTA